MKAWQEENEYAESCRLTAWLRDGYQETKNDKRNEIRLEFVQIDVQGTGKAKRNSDRRDDLSDQSIQIGETRQGNPEVLFADPEDRFVVNLKRMAHYRRANMTTNGSP